MKAFSHEPSLEALSSIRLTLQDLKGKTDWKAAEYVWERHVLPTILTAEDEISKKLKEGRP